MDKRMFHLDWRIYELVLCDLGMREITNPHNFQVIHVHDCIYLGPSMYKHELYYVGHFLHMYDVSDRKTSHMNCKHVYPFPRLVYYRVCFDNILKSDCI